MADAAAWGKAERARAQLCFDGGYGVRTVCFIGDRVTCRSKVEVCDTWWEGYGYTCGHSFAASSNVPHHASQPFSRCSSVGCFPSVHPRAVSHLDTSCLVLLRHRILFHQARLSFPKDRVAAFCLRSSLDARSCIMG